MDQDKHSDQYNAKNKTSLERLIKILGNASSDDETLAKREETSVGMGSIEGDLLIPLKKKLKLEDGLQKSYELNTKIFLPRDETADVTPVKQEESGPDATTKLEDSHSQTASHEHSEKPESNQSHPRDPPPQTEDSNIPNSQMDDSSPQKLETLPHHAELPP
jgi:hypothetical protein